MVFQLLACSRRSDSRAPEKNSRRKKKKRGETLSLFTGVQLNSLPTYRRVLLSERLEQAFQLLEMYHRAVTSGYVTRDDSLRTSSWDASIRLQGWVETELKENCHLDTILFSLLFRINDYESCAEMLLDTLGDEIVNMCDKKDR